MALSFRPTTAPVFLPAPDAADMTTFLHDVHPEVSDALLGFVYDPIDAFNTNAGLDDLLSFPFPNAAAFTTGAPVAGEAAAFLGPVEDEFLNEFVEVEEPHCDKRLRTAACNLKQVPAAALPEFRTELVLPLPPLLPQQPQPLAFVRGADEKKPGGNGGQSAAARERRRRISQKTAELSRLIPGGHRLSTAEMLTEAARHAKLLQAQVGMLALMHSVGSSSDKEKERMPITAAQEEMHALLVSGSVQERLAAEGKCLVPRELVDAVARDKAVKSNPLLNRDLGRFIASLPEQK